MFSKIFKPEFFSLWNGKYSKDIFFNDLVAGIIVGIVALPLSIAFAIASDVKPEQGLFTAIIAGFLISLFSGSKFQIGGPTGAFIVVIYGIIQNFGYDGLVLATMIAGVLLILMGVAKVGGMIKFIPYPVTVGFTSGIALIIFSGQIKDFLGLSIEKMPSDFLDKILVIYKNIETINYYSLMIGIISFLIIKYWSKFSKKLPGSLIAIIVATVITQIFSIPIDTIHSRFGEVPSTIPMPHMPYFSWELFQKVIPAGLTIAFLAGIESLLSAVVADGMTGEKHDSNTEIIGIGIANLFSPLFLGIPATGAIARTATNIKSGGKTPVAGIIHAVVVLFILLFFGKWASLIPMASLAAILIFVAYNMSELKFFIKLFKSPKSDVFVLLITFFLTVFVDLTVAIEVGVVMAALLFMHRMSNVTQLSFFNENLNPEDSLSISKKNIPKDVEVFEINGSFFFGATDRFKDELKSLGRYPKVLILRMRYVLNIDATGIKALEDVLSKCDIDDCKVILSGVNSQPYSALSKSGTLNMLNKENICVDIDLAIERAKVILY